MNKSFLRKEYISRINRVMDFIGRNLDQELDLETLASVACFSPSHFHRLFAAMTGETLGGFIRRIRLERAAGYLSGGSDFTITETAMRCGFTSSSAFARAFKGHFGMSASDWREKELKNKSKISKSPGNHRQCKSKGRKDGISPFSYNCSIKQTAMKRRKAMKVEIKQLPGYHVAYMRHIGPYGPGVSRHWKEFRKWAVAHGFLGRDAVNPIALGISHDDPSITPPAKCRYDSCAVVPEDFKPGTGVNITDIPGGRYAVYRFRGTDKTIGKAWRDIYAGWLPESGYQCDDRPCFELYTAEHQCHSDGSWECDICIPVKPL